MYSFLYKKSRDFLTIRRSNLPRRSAVARMNNELACFVRSLSKPCHATVTFPSDSPRWKEPLLAGNAAKSMAGPNAKG